VNSTKRIGILFILSTFFSFPVNAETRQSGFSISPSVGFLHGQAEELVYRFPDSDLLLSELLWDLKPLFYVGVAIDFGPHDPFRHNGLIMSLSFRYGLPLRTGIHENRDWLNPRINYYTHFSRHDVYSRGAFFANISAGHSWRINNSLAFRAYGEFSFMRLSWSGRDGFIQYPPFDIFRNYPPWSDTIPRIYDGLSGEVIRYTQNWFILAPVISLKWNPFPNFVFAGSLSYSPLIYCFARDDHILRNITFLDYLFFGHYFRGRGEFILSLTENLAFSLALSYKLITGTRGDTLIGTQLIRQGAGAAYSAFNFTLATRMRLSNRLNR
jgi:outer membrane protease